MINNNKIPLRRVSIEAFVIVASILLAFAIDAWWEDLARSEDEVESLDLISRDLGESIEQMAAHIAFAEEASKSAANVYMALSRPGPYDRDYIRNEMLRVDRMTLRIPRAAYTELLSAGRLGVIEDRDLRDSIVLFYESVNRDELVLEKNNNIFLDELVMGTLFGQGLLYSHPNGDVLGDNINSAYEISLQQLDEDFVHLPDPMWSLPADSREWDMLRSTMLYAGHIHGISKIIAQKMRADAVALKTSVDAWLSAH